MSDPNELGPLRRPPSLLVSRGLALVLGALVTFGLIWSLLAGGLAWKKWAMRELETNVARRKAKAAAAAADAGVRVYFLKER